VDIYVEEGVREVGGRIAVKTSKLVWSGHGLCNTGLLLHD